MERPAKIQRLQRLRAVLPFMSQAALAAVLKHATVEDLEANVNRSDVRAARNEATKINTPFGTVHQVIELQAAKGEDPISLEVQHPLAMLHYMASSSESLARLLQQTSQKSPCGLGRPWHIIVYCDEVLPGNQLAYKSARKAWAIYWSILEWGSAALSDEDTCVVRSRSHIVSPHQPPSPLNGG